MALGGRTEHRIQGVRGDDRVGAAPGIEFRRMRQGLGALPRGVPNPGECGIAENFGHPLQGVKVATAYHPRARARRRISSAKRMAAATAR